MDYVVALLVGIAAGAGLAVLCVFEWAKRVRARDRAAESAARQAREAAAALAEREARFDDFANAKRAEINGVERAREARFAERAAEADRLAGELRSRQAQFDARVIAYRELREENAILKRDLQNLDVNLHKLELDGEARDLRQADLTARTDQLAKRYLTENVKAVVQAVGPNNFEACKARLSDAVGRVRKAGFAVPADEEAGLHAALRAEFERAVRAEFERQEQARIRAQIREEERVRREVEGELRRIERERLVVQAALDQALAEARGQHSAAVDQLQARLAEAEARAQRTKSMAEQTKTGHVYVISNVGTLGPGVFKVGMTRRLDPLERVVELGDASVPFPFDVHMMIRCPDAPALENALHRALHARRVNRANPRKEFFRSTIDELVGLVREHHGEVEYVADPEASEYRQSLAMSEADAAFVEQVYDRADGDRDGVVAGDDD
ncbi:MAG: hypothetical protein JWO31_3550 [Phycisphaerales bacterium]|nr:hypothetical protein [Phycisphaerales bacterium]